MISSRASAERQSFEKLVRETRDDLLGYALRRSASVEDAADVVSETYLIAWRKLDRVPQDESARLWLFGVAANVLRRGARRHRSSQALIERLTAEPVGLMHIEPAMHEDITSRLVRISLETLSASDQELLKLSAWEELTPKQIAIATGLSTNVVRVRLHRARSRLRSRLTEARVAPTDVRDPVFRGARADS